MIIFYHMPKTAGRSVTKSFSDKLNHCQINGNNVMKFSLDINKQEGLQFISYHGVDPVKRCQIYDSNFYLTFIRNPIDMFVSFYSYNRYKLSIDDPTYFISDDNLPMKLTRTTSDINEYLDIILHNKIYLFPRYYFDIIVSYNFVGITEKMGSSISKLNNVLRLNLSECYENKISDIGLTPQQKSTFILTDYNRNRLSNELYREIKIYNSVYGQF